MVVINATDASILAVRILSDFASSRNITVPKRNTDIRGAQLSDLARSRVGTLDKVSAVTPSKNWSD